MNLVMSLCATLLGIDCFGWKINMVWGKIHDVGLWYKMKNNVQVHGLELSGAELKQNNADI